MLKIEDYVLCKLEFLKQNNARYVTMSIFLIKLGFVIRLPNRLSLLFLPATHKR